MKRLLAALKGLFALGQDHGTGRKKARPRQSGLQCAREFRLPKGAFSTRLQGWLAGLPTAERASWQAVIAHVAQTGDRSKPSARWLAEGMVLTEAVGKTVVTTRLIELLESTTPDPSAPDQSLELLKAMIWLASGLDHAALASPIGRFVETCYGKVAGVGARSAKLANVGLWALAQMVDEPAAAAELFRLRTRLKQPSAQKALDKSLHDYAAKAGCNIPELEDASLPSFGLAADGRVTAQFGSATGTITLAADGVQLDWWNDGRPLKGTPAAAVREHRVAIAAFRQSAKAIDAARATQAVRLEQAWVEDRSWSYCDWQANILAHPLRRPLARALIWRMSADGVESVILPTDDGFETLSQGYVAVPDHAVVRLWHPLDSTPDDVLGWRERIIERGVTQPFKQAHREICVLTDAERQTRVYSNRFAAHILRQHQFKALCGARGWRFHFIGLWDSWNVPHRLLPHHGLAVEYHVEAIRDGEHSDAYIPLYLTTDQVRFVAPDGAVVPLVQIPPVLFSECLRDVDLFVAVTSVANDSTWTDGGPAGRHAGYWGQWAFGDLNQSSQTRRDLIARLAPKLAIADRLEVTDRFLIVQGRRQKYAIHFGSSNIQILPSKRYLCIVANPTLDGSRELKLPFAGDTMLSIILSKAFLLADESKIKDPTILAQL